MASKYSLDFDDAFSSDTSETSSSHQKDSLNEKQISLVNNLIDQKLAIYLSAVKQPFTSAPVSAAGLFQQLEALNGFATDSARAAIIKIERTLDRGKQSEEEEIRARRLLSLFVAANSSRKRLLAALSHLSTEMQEDVSKIRRGEWSEMEEGEDKNGPCSGLSTRDRLKYLKFEFSQTENEIKVYAERLREQSAVVLEMIVAEIKKSCLQPQSSYKTLSTPLPQPKPLAFAQYVAEERKFKAQFESVLKTKFSALSVAPFSPSSIPTIATDSFASVCSSKTEIEKNQNPHEEKHIKNEKSPENDEKETEMEKEVLLRSSAELLSAHAEGYVCEGQGRAAKDCRLAFSYMLRGRGPAALGFLSSAAPMEQIVSILSGDAALSEAEAADAAAALSSEKTVLRCFLFAAPVIVGAPSSSAAEALKKELFSGNKSNFIARAEFQATVLGRLAASGELGGAFKRFAWRLLALLANGGGRQRFGMKLARIVFEAWEDASNGFISEGKRSLKQFEKLKLDLLEKYANC